MMDEPESPRDGAYGRTMTRAERQAHEPGGAELAEIKTKIKNLEDNFNNLQGSAGVRVHGNVIAADSVDGRKSTERISLTVYWNAGLATIDIEGVLRSG